MGNAHATRRVEAERGDDDTVKEAHKAHSLAMQPSAEGPAGALPTDSDATDSGNEPCSSEASTEGNEGRPSSDCAADAPLPPPPFPSLSPDAAKDAVADETDDSSAPPQMSAKQNHAEESELSPTDAAAAGDEGRQPMMSDSAANAPLSPDAAKDAVAVELDDSSATPQMPAKRADQTQHTVQLSRSADPTIGFGFVIQETTEGRIIVSSLDPTGPAAQLAKQQTGEGTVRVGDEVLAINGVDVSGWSFELIVASMRTTPTGVPLELLLSRRVEEMGNAHATRGVEAERSDEIVEEEAQALPLAMKPTEGPMGVLRTSASDATVNGPCPTEVAAAGDEGRPSGNCAANAPLSPLPPPSPSLDAAKYAPPEEPRGSSKKPTKQTHHKVQLSCSADPAIGFGFALEETGERVIVSSLDPNGPAAQLAKQQTGKGSAIVVGDEVLAVNGLAMSGWPLELIKVAMRATPAGDPLELLLSRRVVAADGADVVSQSVETNHGTIMKPPPSTTKVVRDAGNDSGKASDRSMTMAVSSSGIRCESSDGSAVGTVVWTCDVCRVATFSDYDEAALHEATCAASSTSSSSLAASAMPSTGGGEEKCTGSVAASDTAAVCNAKRPKKFVWVCEFCDIANFQTYEEAARHESTCTGSTQVESTNKKTTLPSNDDDLSRADGSRPVKNVKPRGDDSTAVASLRPVACRDSPSSDDVHERNGTVRETTDALGGKVCGNRPKVGNDDEGERRRATSKRKRKPNVRFAGYDLYGHGVAQRSRLVDESNVDGSGCDSGASIEEKKKSDDSPVPLMAVNSDEGDAVVVVGRHVETTDRVGTKSTSTTASVKTPLDRLTEKEALQPRSTTDFGVRTATVASNLKSDIGGDGDDDDGKVEEERQDLSGKDGAVISDRRCGNAETKKIPKKGPEMPIASVDPPDRSDEAIRAAIDAARKAAVGGVRDINPTLAGDNNITSKMKGVTKTQSGKWKAQVYYAGRSWGIGTFVTLEKASLAYDIAREVLDSGNICQPVQSVQATRNAVYATAVAGVGEKCPRAPKQINLGGSKVADNNRKEEGLAWVENSSKNKTSRCDVLMENRSMPPDEASRQPAPADNGKVVRQRCPCENESGAGEERGTNQAREANVPLADYTWYGSTESSSTDGVAQSMDGTDDPPVARRALPLDKDAPRKKREVRETLEPKENFLPTNAADFGDCKEAARHDKHCNVPSLSSSAALRDSAWGSSASVPPCVDDPADTVSAYSKDAVETGNDGTTAESYAIGTPLLSRPPPSSLSVAKLSPESNLDAASKGKAKEEKEPKSKKRKRNEVLSGQPEGPELLSAIDSLFVNADQDAVTVGDVVRCLETQFGTALSKLTKRAVRLRLTDLVTGNVVQPSAKVVGGGGAIAAQSRCPSSPPAPPMNMTLSPMPLAPVAGQSNADGLTRRECECRVEVSMAAEVAAAPPDNDAMSSGVAEFAEVAAAGVLAEPSTAMTEEASDASWRKGTSLTHLVSPTVENGKVNGGNNEVAALRSEIQRLRFIAQAQERRADEAETKLKQHRQEADAKLAETTVRYDERIRGLSDRHECEVRLHERKVREAFDLLEKMTAFYETNWVGVCDRCDKETSSDDDGRNGDVGELSDSRRSSYFGVATSTGGETHASLNDVTTNDSDDANGKEGERLVLLGLGARAGVSGTEEETLVSPSTAEPEVEHLPSTSQGVASEAADPSGKKAHALVATNRCLRASDGSDFASVLSMLENVRDKAMDRPEWQSVSPESVEHSDTAADTADSTDSAVQSSAPVDTDRCPPKSGGPDHASVLSMFDHVEGPPTNRIEQLALSPERVDASVTVGEATSNEINGPNLTAKQQKYPRGEKPRVTSLAKGSGGGSNSQVRRKDRLVRELCGLSASGTWQTWQTEILSQTRRRLKSAADLLISDNDVQRKSGAPASIKQEHNVEHSAGGKRKSFSYSVAQASPNKKSKVMDSAAKGPTDMMWECHVCQAHNSMSRLRCMDCRAWKGGKMGLTTESTEGCKIIRLGTIMWECHLCRTRNPMSRLRCTGDGCKAWKGGKRGLTPESMEGCKIVREGSSACSHGSRSKKNSMAESKLKSDTENSKLPHASPPESTERSVKVSCKDVASTPDKHHSGQAPSHEGVAGQPIAPKRVCKQLFYQIIWPSLQKLGWIIEKGHRSNDYYYMPPGVTRKAGKGYSCRVDYFDSQKQVLFFLETNERWSSMDEVRSCVELYNRCESVRNDLASQGKLRTKLHTVEWLLGQVAESGQSVEIWHLDSIISKEALAEELPMSCSSEGCHLVACSVWLSNQPAEKPWHSCLDCQEKDFGGWPEVEMLPFRVMSKKHRRLIATKCSQQDAPLMPDVPMQTSDAYRTRCVFNS